jgi:hypothetical protein
MLISQAKETRGAADFARSGLQSPVLSVHMCVMNFATLSIWMHARVQ